MKINSILILIQFLIISIFIFKGVFHNQNYSEYEGFIIVRNNKMVHIFALIIFVLLFIISIVIKLKKSRKNIGIFIMLSIFTIYNQLILTFIVDIRIFVGFKLQILLFSIVGFTGLISTMYLIYAFWNNKWKFNQL